MDFRYPDIHWLLDHREEGNALLNKLSQSGGSNSSLCQSPVVVAGGCGMGSKENFDMLFALAELLGGEVGATRAAVDAGFADRSRMIGLTGLSVRPRLYIACGISGAGEHCCGIDPAAKIISINIDPDAPINSRASQVIVGDIGTLLPQIINTPYAYLETDELLYRQS